MTLFRRLVFLLTLMFWQGGFLFYSTVVIAVGADVLGSHRAQGWITRVVTNYMNIAAAVAIVAWAWEILAQPGTRSNRRLRWLLWSALLLTLAVQAWLHVVMDGLLDPEHSRILNREVFRAWHSRYLVTTTAQWGCAMALLVLTLITWQPTTQSSTPDTDTHT